MKVWVDVESGTYGTGVDNLYIVEVGPENEEYILDGISTLTDEERSKWATSFGTQVKLIGCDDVAHKVEMEPEVYGVHAYEEMVRKASDG